MVDPTSVAARFDVSRRALVGHEAVLGSAEIARGVCVAARRRLAIVGVTDESVRRIDGWLTDDALVTHAVGERADPRPGSVCSIDTAPRLVVASIGALIGPMPAGPSATQIEAPPISSGSPSSLPAGAHGLAVVAVDGRVPRRLVVAASDGLAAADVADLRTPATLEPLDRSALLARVARLLAPAPPTIAALLTSDD